MNDSLLDNSLHNPILGSMTESLSLTKPLDCMLPEQITCSSLPLNISVTSSCTTSLPNQVFHHTDNPIKYTLKGSLTWMHQSAYTGTTADALRTHVDTITSATNAVVGIKRKTAEPTAPLISPKGSD